MSPVRTFLLLGSGEFDPWSAEAERAALALARSGDGSVAILPTASSAEGDAVFDRWANKGLEHYAELGIDAKVVPLRLRDDATRQEFVAQLDGASMVFFSGGRPGHLARTIKDTPFLTALLSALDQGVVFAGCSAGAMVAGHAAGDRGRLDPFGSGLGLVQGTVFGVHWDAIPRWALGAKAFMRSRAPRDTTFVGIDEDTAILGDGTRWQVFGAGGAHVATGKARVTYRAPVTFTT